MRAPKIKQLKKKIIFVASLHGDEQTPAKALAENKIRFILGNPKAYKKNIRYTECDLNAAFGIKDAAYETERAAEILEQIDKDDFIVDFHTTSGTTPPFAIVVDKKMISLAARTGLKHVVIMKHNIKNGHSLIDYRNGISVEAGSHGTRDSYDTTLRVVKNIGMNKKYPIAIYEAYEKITKPGEYVNFRKHPGGFIPILAGEAAYDFYGLKARKIK